MNTERRPIGDHEIGKFHKCTGFSSLAVIAGALVGIGTSFLVNLFMMATGLAAYSIDTATATQTFLLAGFIGLLIGAIISMGLLGWVAGYLGSVKAYHAGYVDDGEHRCNYGCLYGFVAWCLSLTITIFLSAHVGRFVMYTQATMANANFVQAATEVYTRKAVQVTEAVQPNVIGRQQVLNANDVTPKEASTGMATASFVTFLIFFVGAIAASVAGHLGFARYRRKKMMV